MKFLAVFCALWLAAVPALAAPLQPSSSSVPSAVIRPGDTLEIQVASETGLSKSYTVDASGNITVEMVGQVPAAGRTADQLAQELRTRLGRFLKQPTLTVALSAPARQEVLITGEVLRPGAVKLRPGDGLLDALAIVGGLGPRADGTRATLVRRGQAQPQPINAELLLKGDLSQNLSLNDGDIIQVPKREAATYQVVGEVRQPGTRALDGTVRLLDAIVASGGLTDRADRSRVTLSRKDQKQSTLIDLDQVLAGDSSVNVTIQPGDLLSVGARSIIQVGGEVRTPGAQLLRNGGTLMEAILQAGGFGPDADRAAIQITHRDGKSETVTLAEVNGLIGGPALQAGDLVLVGHSKPQVVTVIGAVRTPGQMRYQSGMKITDALLASGLLESAQWKQIRVMRGEDGPGRKMLMFNLEAYLKAPQTANLPLQGGDQIFVEAQRRSGGPGGLQKLLQFLPLANLFFLR